MATRRNAAHSFLAVLLFLPLALGLWQFALPATAFPVRAEGTDEGQGVAPGSSRMILLAEIEQLPHVEDHLRSLQARSYLPLEEGDFSRGTLTTASARSSGQAISALNRWGAIDRTARRHKATLDYFFGFGF